MAGEADHGPLSGGVEALIERLRDEGVAAGRAEADRIVAEAEAKARRIVESAERDAKARVEAARSESEAKRAAGEEALRTAMRDAVLTLKQTLADRFSAEIRRLVARHLDDPDLMHRLVLEVAGRARPAVEGADGPVEVLLPERVVGLEELRAEPEELQDGRLTRLALGITRDMLKDGVTLAVTDEVPSGIRVRIVEDAVELDLTDKAVASILLKHLQPRFRAVLEGVVR